MMVHFALIVPGCSPMPLKELTIAGLGLQNQIARIAWCIAIHLQCEIK
jgi:hypothetical protein